MVIDSLMLSFPLLAVEANYWPLLVPSIAGMLSVSLFTYVYVKFHVQIDAFLSSNRRYRQRFRGVCLFFVPIVVAGCFDIADFSEIGEGRITGRDTIALVLIVAGIPLWLTAQLLESWHLDNWDQRLIAATNLAHTHLARCNAAVQSRDFLIQLTSLTLRIVGLKVDRVRRVLKESRDGPANPQFKTRYDRVREALNPQLQILEAIIAVHHFLELGLPAGRRLRIAFFVRAGDHLQPVYSFDGQNTDAVQTPKTVHRDRFRLEGDTDPKCLAVACATKGQIWILEDAAAASKAPDRPFLYFDDQQSARIKCIVAFPLPRGDGPGPYSHVITIDTDEPTFFKDDEETRFRMKLLQRNLAGRLHFEEEMRELLDGPTTGESNGNTT